MNWYNKVFRKIHWDYDNPSFVKGVGDKFDAAEFVQALKKANVEAINFFAKDVFSQFYVELKTGHKHPGLKRNLLKEIVEICHKNRIKVLFYYVVVETRTPKKWSSIGGNPWGGPCIHSPYLEKMVLPEIKELAETYKPDGFFFDIISQNINRPCYCQYCRVKVAKKFKRAIPKKERDPFWPAYLKWQREGIDNFEKRIAETIHKVNPKILFGSNNSYVLSRPESPPAYLDYFTIDVVEGGITSSNLLAISQQARYLSTLNRPFDIMNSRFLYWWRDWMLKPVASLKQECATLMANGGKCFIGDKIYPDGTLDKKVMETIGETFEFVKEREGFCRDVNPVPYIGILHSASTCYNGDGSTSVRGTHKALVESALHFNILNEETLLKDIFSYKALILPEQLYLSKKVMQVIKEFVKKGGGLIASYKTGMKDEKGNPTNDFFDLLGVRYQKEYQYKTGYIKAIDKKIQPQISDFPILVQSKFIQVMPDTAQILALLVDPLWEISEVSSNPIGPPGEDSGFPAVTLNQYGKGKAAFITGEVFSNYWNKNNPHLKYLIKNLVNLVTSEKVIEVEAPPCIEVSLFEQRGKKIVHLVNSHTEKVLSGVSFAEYIPPIYGIKVRLRVDKKVKRVFQEPEHKKVAYTTDGSYISFKAPKVDIHSIIVIE